MRIRGHRLALVTVALALVAALVSCASPVVPLMPTPILFTEVGLDPMGHVPADQRWTPRRVYYATIRERAADLQRIDYSNRPADHLSFGMALIGFGGPDTSWADLSQASRSRIRAKEFPLSIAGVVEAGRAQRDADAAEVVSPDRAGWLLEDLNDAIEDSRDPDVLVYVHGAKVNFYNACAYAAQLDHFMGRDMTSIAFSWPSRQNLLAYGLGGDLARAEDAGPALATLLEILALGTQARRIHVLSWSAGARVVTAAARELRARHPDEALEALRERLRIGTWYYAAGDIPRSDFLEVLPILHALGDRTVVTASSKDDALISAAALMGGDTRIGQKGGDPLDPPTRAWLASLERLEIVDVSAGHEGRGFDITGHRYWFDHPWASADVILSVRSDLAAGDRGLQQGEVRVLWSIPSDYPARLRESLESQPLRKAGG